MKRTINYLAFSVLIFLFGGCCQKKNTQHAEKISVDKVHIADYGRALFYLDPMDVKKGLDSLSDEFRFFIGDNPDTLSVIQIRDFITDPFNRELADKYFQVYPDLVFLEDGLTELFSRVKANHAEFRVPAVYAYISGLMYESPVEYLDSVMIIGMDMFLGWNTVQYRAAGLPVYMTRRMEPPHVLPACARQIAYSIMPEKVQPKSLLDYMILHGKILYAMDRFLPGLPDSLKIGYTNSQVAWCEKNEASIWRLMIDQEMLYKNDAFLNNRFIQDGPFTSGLPEGAPAMLGRYIGWQIVRSYMKKHPEIALDELFRLEDSQQILSQSGYKPKK